MPCRFLFRLPAMLLTLAVLASLPGCAGVSASVDATLNPPPALRTGMSEAEVAAQMGTPTGRYALPAGATRLEYAKGPYGVVTYMVDLDASGRSSAWAQVLDQEHFAKLKKGMGKEAVLLLLGRPGQRAAESQGRESWYWRFRSFDCQRLAVTFDERGRVTAPFEVLVDQGCNTPGV